MHCAFLVKPHLWLHPKVHLLCSFTHTPNMAWVKAHNHFFKCGAPTLRECLVAPGDHLTPSDVLTRPFPRWLFHNLSFVLKPSGNLFLCRILSWCPCFLLCWENRSNYEDTTSHWHCIYPPTSICPYSPSWALSQANLLLMHCHHPLLSIHGNCSRNCPLFYKSSMPNAAVMPVLSSLLISHPL